MKRVEISQAAFSKVDINNGKVVAVKEKLRKNVHKLLDEWLDKPEYPDVGDGIIFEVVEDRDSEDRNSLRGLRIIGSDHEDLSPV
ncbi:hypothetical protein ES703_08203 [subsurface metagenome]